MKGLEIHEEAIDNPQFEFYKHRKMDLHNPTDVSLLREFLGAKEGDMVNGMKLQSAEWQK